MSVQGGQKAADMLQVLRPTEVHLHDWDQMNQSPYQLCGAYIIILQLLHASFEKEKGLSGRREEGRGRREETCVCRTDQSTSGTCMK